MKYKACISAEYWFDIEAESEKEAVEKIKNMQNVSIFDKLTFKKPFVMADFTDSVNRENADKEYNELLNIKGRYYKCNYFPTRL